MERQKIYMEEVKKLKFCGSCGILILIKESMCENCLSLYISEDLI